MIKRFLIAFAAMLMCVPPFAVHADVVMGNEFLSKNKDSAVPLNEKHYGKRMIVNSPDGYVIPKMEPGSEEGVPTEPYSYKGTSPGGRSDKPYTYEDDFFVFKNSEIITITHVYLYDGRYWGVMGHSHTYQPPGWIPMDELLVLYDQQDFEIQNRDHFYLYTGSYDAVLSASKLVQWAWPGSDKDKRVIESDIANYAKVLLAYTDSDGREWGKTIYSEKWICLSDPESINMSFSSLTPQSAPWSPDGIDWFADVTIYPPVQPSGTSFLSPIVNAHAATPIVISIAVAVVVIAGTTILVVMLRKKRER